MGMHSSTKIFHQRPYREGLKEPEFDRQQIQKLLDFGVDKPSNFEWVTPVVLEPRNDRGLRSFIDYRGLKSILIALAMLIYKAL